MLFAKVAAYAIQAPIYGMRLLYIYAERLIPEMERGRQETSERAERNRQERCRQVRERNTYRERCTSTCPSRT